MSAALASLAQGRATATLPPPFRIQGCKACSSAHQQKLGKVGFQSTNTATVNAMARRCQANCLAFAVCASSMVVCGNVFTASCKRCKHCRDGAFLEWGQDSHATCIPRNFAKVCQSGRQSAWSKGISVHGLGSITRILPKLRSEFASRMSETARRSAPSWCKEPPLYR